MPDLLIKLEGFPEKVHRIADAIEYVFPGLIAWVQAEDIGEEITIRIEGYENPAMHSSILKDSSA